MISSCVMFRRIEPASERQALSPSHDFLFLIGECALPASYELKTGVTTSSIVASWSLPPESPPRSRVIIKPTGNGSIKVRGSVDQRVVQHRLHVLHLLTVCLDRLLARTGGYRFLDHIGRVFLSEVWQEVEVDDLPGDDVADAGDDA